MTSLQMFVNMGLLNGKLTGPFGHFVITAYFVMHDLATENFYSICIGHIMLVLLNTASRKFNDFDLTFTCYPMSDHIK